MISQKVAYNVLKRYDEERFENRTKEFYRKREIRLQEVRNFLHDRFIVGSSFDEAYEDNMTCFTREQAYEIEVIYKDMRYKNETHSN